jgi:PEP-CTERM motif
MSFRIPLQAALAALAGLLAGAAQAAPIQLDYSASFDTCSGGGCTDAIATSLWRSISGSVVYDPALSSGWVAPPNGSAPDRYSVNRVHTFSGTQAFSATLTAGSLVARSTGINFPPSPASAWNGIAPTSGALAVYDGERYRQGDRVQFIDQSMTDITGGGLPAGWSTAPSIYGGGVAARLSLVFAYAAGDNALTSADIPLDMDAIPHTPSLQAISFGFYWTAPGYQPQWVDYSGRITRFSSAPHVPPGGDTPTGGSTAPTPGGSVPEPASLMLAGLALAAAGAVTKRRRVTAATAA